MRPILCIHWEVAELRSHHCSAHFLPYTCSPLGPWNLCRQMQRVLPVIVCYCCVVLLVLHSTPDSLHWHRAESWVITLLLNFRQVVTHRQLEEEQHQNAIKYRTVTNRPLIKMWSYVTVRLNMTESYQDVTDMHFFFFKCVFYGKQDH